MQVQMGQFLDKLIKSINILREEIMDNLNHWALDEIELRFLHEWNINQVVSVATGATMAAFEKSLKPQTEAQLPTKILE